MAFMNWTDLLGTLMRSYARIGGTNSKMLEAYRSLAGNSKGHSSP